MENNDVATLLDKALSRFEGSGTNFEHGLNVDDAALLQLRKACRMIDAATFLEEHDGYYTVMIEMSFAALERTIQFYLLDIELLQADEYVDHTTVYDRGRDAGLYDQEFAAKLMSLWRNNRSDTYYRSGVATERRAAIMLELAETSHSYILQLAGASHECICDVANSK